VERSVGWVRRELDVRGGTAAGIFRLRSANCRSGEPVAEVAEKEMGEATAVARELIVELEFQNRTR